MAAVGFAATAKVYGDLDNLIAASGALIGGKKVFGVISKIGYMVFCTVGLDGVTPTSRGLEVYSLDDTGDLFIGLCPGKTVYKKLKRNPRISGTIIVPTVGKLTYSIRINATEEETSDCKIIS